MGGLAPEEVNLLGLSKNVISDGGVQLAQTFLNSKLERFKTWRFEIRDLG